jgi:hypothetical protein
MSEPYTGLIYAYPGGQVGGIPLNFYEAFERNKLHYIKLGKPIPRHFTQVREPDGSVWEYAFSYDNPFSYLSRRQISLMEISPTTGEITKEQTVIGPDYPWHRESPTTIPDDQEIVRVTKTSNGTLLETTGSWGDMSALVVVGVLGLTIAGLLRKRK